MLFKACNIINKRANKIDSRRTRSNFSMFTVLTFQNIEFVGGQSILFWYDAPAEARVINVLYTTIHYLLQILVHSDRM